MRCPLGSLAQDRNSCSFLAPAYDRVLSQTLPPLVQNAASEHGRSPCIQFTRPTSARLSMITHSRHTDVCARRYIGGCRGVHEPTRLAPYARTDKKGDAKGRAAFPPLIGPRRRGLSPPPRDANGRASNDLELQSRTSGRAGGFECFTHILLGRLL